ncbi:MAG: division/cell wall cluster transcriptional repressor MraZ [Candidatus Marinimicrobia bacterium]|nr:division/cell wall cluster transcriptional repressor MraZ [Candidatus Neomarinimicrobiota bacterium]
MFIDFIGQFQYNVDSKNRVNIPSRFRKSLSEKGISNLVISKGIDEFSIVIYPEPQWENMMNKLNESLSSLKQTHKMFLRQITRFASKCPIDSAGRITLTNDLMKYAKIEKEVIIVGTLNKIEIWEPEILEKYEQENPLSKEDFNSLANDILI